MADDAADKRDSPLSLKRLTAAFAQMLGGKSTDSDAEAQPATSRDPCELSPRSIVEGVLFVGAAENKSHTAEELAAAMRDVDPAEVIQAIEQLNAAYERDAAPYYIAKKEGGYRLVLRTEMGRMRDKFLGRVKESRISPAAMEVLSIVAYKQPVTIARIDEMRGDRSGSIISSLVRRGLVRLDRSTGEPTYQTTDRFLRLFGLAATDQLPRAAEMDA